MQQQGMGAAFGGIRHLLDGADFVLGNLEGPLTTATEPTAGKDPDAVAEGRDFLLKAAPATVEGLRRGGITCLALANNHTMDYQAAGLRETLAVLDKAGITYAGAGEHLAAARQVRVLTVRERKIGVLSASMINPVGSHAGPDRPGIWALPKVWTPELAHAITQARAQCDFLIFTVHWGIESTLRPADYQQVIARKAIEHGVDLVVGHHPHVLQPFEWYQGKLIAYSLGNACFPGKSKKLPSAMLEVQLGADQHYSALLHPLLVESGIPQPTRERNILSLLQQLAPDVPVWAPPVESR